MLKCFKGMKLRKKLSPKQFIVSHFLILLAGILFLAGLYFILNIQYQKSNNPFLSGPVTSAPKTLRLDLDSPSDDGLSFQSSIIVSGQTSPFKEVLIFTNSQDLVVMSKKDGSFSTILTLDEGVNRITAAVFDTNGDTKTQDRTVYYSKEKL